VLNLMCTSTNQVNSAFHPFGAGKSLPGRGVHLCRVAGNTVIPQMMLHSSEMSFLVSYEDQYTVTHTSTL